MEVIRRAPNVPQPFELLALIHEDQENSEQAMDFLLIAANMTPKAS